MLKYKPQRLFWVILFMMSLFVLPIAQAQESEQFSIEELFSQAVTHLTLTNLPPSDQMELDKPGLILRPGLQVTNVAISYDAKGTVYIAGKLEGAEFSLRFPANWNRQFVLYAHGYTGPTEGPTGLKLARHANEELFFTQSAFLQGFATGHSEYSKLGYAVKDGMFHTNLLHRLVSYMGTKRTYLVGVSMGGNISMGLVEKYPNDYTGTITLCGVVAGWYEEIRYLTDFALVYSYFTKPLGAPFKLPNADDVVTPNPDSSLTNTVTSVVSLFTVAAKNPQFANIIRQISVITGANPDPISFITALGGDSSGTVDLLETSGGLPYSNVGKEYKGSDDDVALNAGIQRFEASSGALNYINNWFTPSGSFATKLLSIHNTIDPLVPYEQEPLLRAKVAAQNNLGNFAQQVVDAAPVNLADLSKSGPAHCYFAPGQINSAWNSVRGWVENGTKPQDGANITTNS